MAQLESELESSRGRESSLSQELEQVSESLNGSLAEAKSSIDALERELDGTKAANDEALIELKAKADSELSATREELANLSTVLLTTKGELEETQASAEASTTLIKELETTGAALTSRAELAESHVQELMNEVAQLKSAFEDKEQSLHAVIGERDTLSAKLPSITAELEAAQKQLKESELTCADLQVASSALTRAAGEAEKESSAKISSLESSVEELRGLVESNKKSSSDMIESLHVEGDQMRGKLARIERDKARGLTEIEGLTAANASLKAELAKLGESVSTANDEAAARTSASAVVRAELESLQDKYNALLAELSQSASDLESANVENRRVERLMNGLQDQARVAAERVESGDAMARAESTALRDELKLSKAKLERRTTELDKALVDNQSLKRELSDIKDLGQIGGGASTSEGVDSEMSALKSMLDERTRELEEAQLLYANIEKEVVASREALAKGQGGGVSDNDLQMRLITSLQVLHANLQDHETKIISDEQRWAEAEKLFGGAVQKLLGLVQTAPKYSAGIYEVLNELRVILDTGKELSARNRTFLELEQSSLSDFEKALTS